VNNLKNYTEVEFSTADEDENFMKEYLGHVGNGLIALKINELKAKVVKKNDKYDVEFEIHGGE
jgi:hypothetical protein